MNSGVISLRLLFRPFSHLPEELNAVDELHLAAFAPSAYGW